MKALMLFKTIKAYLKVSVAQLYVATIGRKYLDKEIWIIGEKKTEARDNGFHFYKYLRTEHPNVEAYYVIKRGSADEIKVKQLGDVIAYDSFKHCILYSAAKYRVCSQNHGVRPFENIPGIRHIRLYMRKGQHHVNLKHGISKDFLPGSFDFKKVGFDLYIAGAKPEYDAIKEQFNYPDKNIALTGFCRFDALHGLPKPEKVILVMPTFRLWLKTSDSAKAVASEQEMKHFIQSRYYHALGDLLSNEQLLERARQYGYKILFYLHYTFQPYIKAFDCFANDVVTICERKKYDVQKLLISSSMLITDYSSVFFDYGYMMKPMVFYQFDLEEYRSNHYQEGYFSYERDSFGPVFKATNEVVEYIKRMIENDMVIEPVYKLRAKSFFIPYDNHNCERVYNAILKLDGE